MDKEDVAPCCFLLLKLNKVLAASGKKSDN